MLVATCNSASPSTELIANSDPIGVEWLIEKYKLYIMLRERLLMDTPHLRGSITKARSGPESINDASFGGKRGAPLPPSNCALDS